jgi:hypothetical protein
MPAPRTPRTQTQRWTPSLPHEPGFWELWDPTCRVNRIVEVIVDGLGRLVIRAPRGGLRDLPLDVFPRDPAHGTRWCGPIRVPEALPAEPLDAKTGR